MVQAAEQLQHVVPDLNFSGFSFNLLAATTAKESLLRILDRKSATILDRIQNGSLSVLNFRWHAILHLCNGSIEYTGNAYSEGTRGGSVLDAPDSDEGSVLDAPDSGGSEENVYWPVALPSILDVSAGVSEEAAKFRSDRRGRPAGIFFFF